MSHHNRAIAMVRDEHRSLGAVVHGLEFLMREIGAGRLGPDFPLLWSMLVYIEQFAEVLHNRKEETLIFERLRQLRPACGALIDTLEADHRAGDAAVIQLMRALGYWEAGASGAQEHFLAHLDTFTRFCVPHMRREEGELLPLARESFSETDWQAVLQGFSDNGEPLVSEADKLEVEALFERILERAPAPIGLGRQPV